MSNIIDLSLKLVAINFSPGSQYAEKSRKWQDIPGIERAALGHFVYQGCSEDQFNHLGKEYFIWISPTGN